MKEHVATSAPQIADAVKSTLLVASTGGHLQELVSLRGRLQPAAQRVEWVTHDSPQARSILKGELVHYFSHVPPRGYAAAARAFPAALQLISGRNVDRLISTGAGIAVPLIAAARTRGIPCHYIESAARTRSPSLTGRLVAPLPGVRAYTQHAGWADGTWLSRGSLFDGYEAVALDSHRLQRVLVLLGTGAGFPFNRAINRLRGLLPSLLPVDATVVWQIGESDGADLPGDVHRLMSPKRLVSTIQDSDLVIAHAGVGSALMALEQGKCPVLLPRHKQYGEHVDDHQVLIAAELEGRGIAVRAEVDELSGDHLIRASSRGVRQPARPLRFRLAE